MQLMHKRLLAVALIAKSPLGRWMPRLEIGIPVRIQSLARGR